MTEKERSRLREINEIVEEEQDSLLNNGIFFAMEAEDDEYSVYIEPEQELYFDDYEQRNHKKWS